MKTSADLKIMFRTGQPHCTSVQEISEGRYHREYEYTEKFKITSGEEVLPEDWIRDMKAALQEEGKSDLVKQLKEYVRIHCVWLKKEEEIDIYAMDAAAGGAYKAWNDFCYQESMTFV